MHAISSVADEIDRRTRLWAELNSKGSPANAAASVVKSLGIYGGQAGIYRDVTATQSSAAPDGIAVSVRHNGTSYADDLSEDGMLYHYPLTARSGRTDKAEIESAKAAGKNAVPLFVVLGPKGSKIRDVRIGYVVDFDDRSKLFLITFTNEIVVAESPRDSQPFELTSGDTARVLQMVQARPNHNASR